MPSGLFRNPNAYDRDLEAASEAYAPTRNAGTARVSGAARGQTSTQVDTSYFDLPLVLEAGPLAALCYLASLLYTTRHATNGVIPAGALGALTDWEQLGTTGRQAADRCVAVGLMERTGNSYRLLDYRQGSR